MKQLILFLFIGFSLISYGQNNAPVAVDDTLIYYYDELNYQDTVEKSFNVQSRFIINDTDPDNDLLSMDTAFIVGSSGNFIELLPNNTSPVLILNYNVVSPFFGIDSIKYVLKDDGNPVMYDTGTIYIIVMPQLHAMLDANNISARVDKFTLFSTYPGLPGFEAPKGSGIHSIFGTNLWVAGKNNNVVHSSVKTFGWADNSGTSLYNQGSNSGPVSNSSSQYVEFNEKWDRVWKVKQYEIDYHLANWSSTNYNPPQSLVDWPAHGDPSLGEALMLAPFFDYDQDGVYNPYSGDYPIIKGDQAIYFIYNDGGSSLSQNPMTSEVHGMAYAFQCQDSALQNTIFVDYRIINRSTNTYDSTYFGMWTDSDLGNPQDDYIQCDVDRSLFFTFNGDAFDDNANGRPGYGNHLAAQGVLTLKGAKQDNDGQDNSFGIGSNQTINGSGFGDGVTDNEYWGMQRFSYYNNGGGPNGDPQNDIEFYNLMNSTIPRFMFPDTSDSYSYGTGGVSMPAWNEVTANNTPGDRRGVSSTGPVTFSPGDEIEITYAFVFGRDYVNTGAQAGVTNMLERVDSIRSYFDQGMLSACGFPVSVQNPIDTKSDLVIYPNPTTNVINIRQEKATSIQIQVLDITGKILLTTSSKNQLTTIDLSGFVKGVYLVKVFSGNKTSIQKLIKN